MRQDDFIDALLPAGFGRNARLESIGKVIDWQAVRNKLIGRIRQGVERTFSQIKGRNRFTRVRYRGLAANAFHLDLVALAYNLRTAAAALA